MSKLNIVKKIAGNSEQITFDDDEYLLLTENNIQAIGKALEDKRYKWSNGSKIFDENCFITGHWIHIHTNVKRITFTRYYPGNSCINIEYFIINI